MNTDSHYAAGDPHELDLLVDGELPEPRRAELLALLEREPEGWRRLALAFLEAQCWGESARQSPQSDSAPFDIALAARPETTMAAVRPASQPSRWKSLLGTPLAMAASFLIAFGLGLVLRDARNASETDAPAMAAVNAEQSTRPGSFPDAIALSDKQPLGDSDLSDVDPVGEAYAADDFDEIWLPANWGTNAESQLSGGTTQAVPEQVQRSLRRLGHAVETHRSLWPVDLKNGRRVVVPVEEVEIRYVGTDYQ